MIGKTVLITGAARRVGRAIALELHAAGANVLLHYRKAADDARALPESSTPNGQARRSVRRQICSTSVHCQRWLMSRWNSLAVWMPW